MSYRTTIIAALFFLHCATASGANAETVLASFRTDKEGNVPAGFHNSGDMRIYADGRMDIFGSKASLRSYASPLVLKALGDKPDWHSAKTTPALVQKLKQKIDSTDFDKLEYDKTRPRPSDHDATDVIAEFNKQGKTISVRLWELRNANMLKPILNTMHECKRAAFAPAPVATPAAQPLDLSKIRRPPGKAKTH